MKPRNFEEWAVWWAIVGTYGFYLVGGLYILAPVLAWTLTGCLIWRLWRQNAATPQGERVQIPVGVAVWVLSMLAMELALVVGHLDFDLGTASLIKSSIGWAKGWALLALFPLIGCLKIRPQLLSRAACLLGLQTLIVLPLFVAAYLLKLPPTLYVSPLQVVGGPGPEFFSLSLYEIDPGNGLPRWRLFAPWAPALGMTANVYFYLALAERDWRWRWVGTLACVAMCLISQSRLAALALPVVWGITWLLANLYRPGVLVGSGLAATALGLLQSPVREAYENFARAFEGARANSSRVRDLLGRIAFDRWQNEAPVWGHGVLEPGPHSVEHMLIGSHHTWLGLLFVKGAVGFAALAAPML